MHILCLIDSLIRGGAEQSLASLAPYYRDAGMKVDVAYLHERPGLQEELASSGVELFCLAGGGGRAGWVRRARSLMLRRRPDLIHTTLFEADFVGRLAARLSNIPSVTSLVNEAYGPDQMKDPDLSRWKLQSARLVDAVTARLANRFHAVSAATADVMSSRLHIPRDRVDVIPRGRDPNKLGSRSWERADRTRRALNVGPNTPMVLAVGRQEYQKGFDVLLEAFSVVLGDVPTARLFLAGREGNLSRVLRKRADEIKVPGAVRFLGNRADVPDLLCAADLFVLASRWEGHAGVLLEAMALETPIIGTELRSVRSTVGPDQPLVPPDGASDLARAIIAALSDRNGSENRAHRLRQRFLQQFTTEKIAQQMIEFYERALAA